MKTIPSTARSRIGSSGPRSEGGDASPVVSRTLSPGRAVLLPCGLGVAMGLLALLPVVRQHTNVLMSVVLAGTTLILWASILYLTARRGSRALVVETVLRKQHWMQACGQTIVLLYWGWYVRSVYAFLPLILAQLLFAYGIDSLLTWSRRKTYQLGFGPFPVILSINLFLWFKPEWLYWQFVMIALGFAAKEFIRWERDGRRVHIFNPSSLPLGVFSVFLLLSGSTGMTLGPEIAQTQFNPPHMYLVIFLAALPAQLLFGVARMTMSAVVTMYLIGLLYLNVTGTYLHYDSFIPLPVFLGMHLLFTDPSTSPRSESGRIMFGVLYALGTTASYVLLGWLGAPRFYDKLLPVPFMNLAVRRIDRLAMSRPFAILDPAKLGRRLTPARRNLVYGSIWTVVFLAMSAGQAVGDQHQGQFLPFWESACEAGSDRGCDYAMFRKFIFCEQGSGWGCNEWGIDLVERKFQRAAYGAFRRACNIGFSAACDNQNRSAASHAMLARSQPRLEDWPIVLRGSKGPVRERDSVKLYALACAQGWPRSCEAGGTSAPD